MAPAGESDQFVFINGPRLAAAGTAADRRRIRSQLMRRLHLERQEQKDQSREITQPTKYEFVEELSVNLRTGLRLAGGNSDDAELSLCSLCASKATTAAGTDTGAGTVCGHCGQPIWDAKQGSKSRKRSDTSRLKLRTTKTISFPVARFGSGKIDPFGGPADGRGMPGYNELIEHFFRKLMPSMRRMTSWTEGCFDAYLKSTWSPLLFHSSCMAISVHLERTARNNGALNYPSRALEQMYHKGAALKALQEALTQPVFGTTLLDEIVLCICFLAVHDDIKESLQKDYNPFNPPLQDLQALDFYGFSAFHPVHWNAIVELTTKNGGLHTVKLYGAPWFLSYTALKYAMFTNSTPSFPVSDPAGKQYGTASPFKILGISAQPFHKTFSHGFRQLQALQINSCIIQTFVDLSELAQGIELYLPMHNDACAMDLLGDTRNVVQYRMIFLPKPSGPLESIFDDTSDTAAIDVYHACWLATLLFSTHVTFPIPNTQPTREGLVPKLREAISTADCPANGTEASEILLWCTMIGGIGSEDGDPAHRTWYTAQLKKLCLALDVKDWITMRGLMRSFAWVDSSCDAGGYQLWMEAYPAREL